MHVTGRKNLIWISLVIILTASMFTVRIQPSTATPSTVLSVDPPIIIDKTKTSGETFSVNIAIASVTNMWGFQFYLSYDTSVLTATSYTNNPLFYFEEPGEINDDPTVEDEYVGMGTGYKTFFLLDNYPLRPSTDTEVYFAVVNETVGTGDGATSEFYLDHYPVRSDTPPSDKVYFAVVNETVGTGDGATSEFYLDHYPVRTGTDKVYLSVTNETVGTGDGTTRVFLLDHPVKSGTDKVYLDGVLQTRDVDYNVEHTYGKITFTAAPASEVSITADYTYPETNYNMNYDTGKITFLSTHVPNPGAAITADYIYVTTDYSIEYDTGKITFTAAPEEGVVMLADYIYIPNVAYTVDYDTGEVTFEIAPEKGIGILMDYKYQAYIVISFHMAPGTSVGFTGSLPNLATIQFIVDDYGWSPLDLRDSFISDPLGDEITHEEVDGYFANEIHDIAITAITSSTTDVTKPDPVYINVTVKNEGDLSETFDVTVYYDDTPVETRTDVTLSAGVDTTLTFPWDTTYVPAPTTYEISSIAGPVPGEPETKLENNTKVFGAVTVNKLTGAPSPDFTYLPERPVELEPVTFNASTSTPDGGTIVRYEWDFGDGTTEIYIDGVNLTDTVTHAYDTIGTYFVTLNVTNSGGLSDAVGAPPTATQLTIYRCDIAIVDVAPTKTKVPRRDILYIDVMVVNQGTDDTRSEAFNVTAYFEEAPTEWTEIATQRITLKPRSTREPSHKVKLPWNTKDVLPDTYTIKAVADTVPFEALTDNNVLTDGKVTIIPKTHNIHVTNVTVSPTIVSLGETVFINVTAANEGDYPEIFGLTTISKDPSTDVSYTLPRRDVSLAIDETKIIEFMWNTTDVKPGVYEISGRATTVPGESVEIDNRLKFNGTVKISGHDIAIREFEVSPPPVLGVHRVTLGEIVTIKVKIYNGGTANETFSTTVYYDDHSIETKTVKLENATSKWVTFTWDTTEVAEGTYTIKAVADTVPGERPIDTDDNTLEYGLKVKIGHHDVAVTNVAASPTEVLVGEPIYINVTVKNQGIFSERNLNVTVKYDSTNIETRIVTYLEGGASTTLNFTWDTTDVTPGTYPIQAVASPVPGELPINRHDNTLIGLTLAVKVTSTITISANPANITVGETTTINGSITPTRVGATVTIWFRISGGTWDVLAIVITNENGQYSYSWKYVAAGTYEVKASWGGDASALDAESDLQNIAVEGASGSDFVLYAVAGGAIITVVVIVYFLRFRKSKAI